MFPENKYIVVFDNYTVKEILAYSPSHAKILAQAENIKEGLSPEVTFVKDNENRVIIRGNKMDTVDLIMEYECGELEEKKVIELFSELIKSGQAWSLQGSYGRMAMSLIEQGVLSKNGFIDWERYHDIVHKYA